MFGKRAYSKEAGDGQGKIPNSTTIRHNLLPHRFQPRSQTLNYGVAGADAAVDFLLSRI
jgi:hypothetical protein